MAVPTDERDDGRSRIMARAASIRRLTDGRWLLDAFRTGRREGPHRFTQKRPRTLASALRSVAAVETSKNQLSRDFRRCSIFDFCNSIGAKRTLAKTSTSPKRVARVSPVADQPSMRWCALEIGRDCRSAIRHVHLGLPSRVPLAVDRPLDLCRQLKQQPIVSLLCLSLNAKRQPILMFR